MTLKSWFLWLKIIESYTNEFLSFYFLLVINSIVPEAVCCAIYDNSFQ